MTLPTCWNASDPLLWHHAATPHRVMDAGWSNTLKVYVPAMYGGKGHADESQVCLQCAWAGNVFLSSLRFSASSQKTLPTDLFMGSAAEESVAAPTQRQVLVLPWDTQRAKFVLDSGGGGGGWRGVFVTWKAAEKLWYQYNALPARIKHLLGSAV